MNLMRTLCLSSLTLLACGMETEKPMPNPPTQDPVVSKKATINVVHASPDAPAVDVYLNGQLAVKALGTDLTIMAMERTNLSPGQSIALAIAPEMVHVFDAASGRRLGP